MSCYNPFLQLLFQPSIYRLLYFFESYILEKGEIEGEVTLLGVYDKEDDWSDKNVQLNSISILN